MVARDLGTPLPNESYCQTIFEAWLRERQPSASIEWRYNPRNEQEDNPDYYLTIDNRVFAVEVSGLARLLPVGDKLLDEPTVTPALWSFIRTVKEEALRAGMLEGAYIVHFQRPIANFGTVKHSLKREILSYIERTKAEEASPTEVIGDDLCRIEKSRIDRNTIYPVGPGDGGFDGEICAAACDLLQKAVASQLNKTWARRTDLPIILLLRNYYPLADLEMYAECTTTDYVEDKLHTVFVIQSDTGLPLYSREEQRQMM